MPNLTDISCLLGFSNSEIAEAIEKKSILSLELEFTHKCNLRCLYCYSNAAYPLENELNVDELQSVIYQAKELGAKKIILLGGGEPLLFHGVIEIINFIDSLGLEQVIFTNATLLTKEIAHFLHMKKVTVIVKRNSLNEDVQDILAGVKGTFKSIEKGLKNLFESGYPDNNAKLGVQTVICKHNMDELTDIWIWARNRTIIPYFEKITYQGRAKENKNELYVSLKELKAAFSKLDVIDREMFDISWDIRPVIAAFTCKRHLYSCIVNSQGYIQPCPGVDIQIGNVRENSLKSILDNSIVIKDLRNIYNQIEGECRVCQHRYECYGCRGNAYQITGNYLASDPLCWNCNMEFYENSPNFCK